MDFHDIQYIKKKKQFNLSTWQFVQAYSFSILALIALIYITYLSLKDYLEDGNFDYGIIIIVFIIFLLLTFQRKRTLKFISYDYHPTEEQFHKAISTSQKELNLLIFSLESNFLNARYSNLNRSRDPLEITIFYDRDGIHINSMIEIGFLSFPFTIGNRNIVFKTFLKHLKNEINGIDSETELEERIKARTREIEIDVEDKSQINTEGILDADIIPKKKTKLISIPAESQWSFKNILKRIVAYFFISIWYSIAIFLSSESYDIILVLSPALILGGFYIYTDIQNIINEYKYNKAKKAKENQL